MKAQKSKIKNQIFALALIFALYVLSLSPVSAQTLKSKDYKITKPNLMYSQGCVACQESTTATVQTQQQVPKVPSSNLTISFVYLLYALCVSLLLVFTILVVIK